MTTAHKWTLGLLILVSLFVGFLYMQSSPQEKYALALSYTPVFHSPNLKNIFGGSDGKTLKLDDSKQIDELEFIALPNTAFTITDSKIVEGIKVYRVITSDVSDETEGKGYWIDARFVQTQNIPFKERITVLPPENEIITSMKSASGSLYVWGGNVHTGLSNLLEIYKPAETLDTGTKNNWQLRGVDCSGLLYEATNGYTPRNTSALVEYGKPIEIAGLTASEISKKLKPLDLIVWKGHLMIVINDKQTIESRWDYDKSTPEPEGGVRVRDLQYVLQETIDSGKIPVNNYADQVPEGKKKFVVRRWYEHEKL